MWLNIVVILFSLSLLFGLMWRVSVESNRRNEGKRSPVTDKVLRPAGESLRVKLDELQEKLTDNFIKYVLLTFYPALVVLFIPAMQTAASKAVIFVVFFLLASPFLFRFGRATLLLFRERAKYRLGYSGERAVGEVLNELLADGCRVYHDVIFEEVVGKPFNIDHVVVSPCGVYAIETKTRRKTPDMKDRNYEIHYDGKTVMLPNGGNAHGLEQAVTNAKHLSKWISGAVGEVVKAKAVLTFPGYFVKTTNPGEVTVLNPKMIRGFVLPGRNCQLLPEKLLRQINHQLEQKCRNLEL